MYSQHICRRELSELEVMIAVQILRGHYTPWVRAVIKLFPHHNEILFRSNNELLPPGIGNLDD